MTKIKPKENKEKKPVVNQVYQGKFMRENESLWSKFFFSFAKPILDSSIEQEICFEQYGNLPDRLKTSYESERLLTHINYYTAKKQGDKYAFMKGVLSANRQRFALFVFIRFCLSL